MPQTLDALNTLSEAQLAAALTRCCGSGQWVGQMLGHRPYRNLDELLQLAETVWNNLTPQDWQEAFSHHPKIGDLASLREKFQSTARWSTAEQAGVNQASDETLMRLAEGNRLYEERFGYIFIVCATGKSAEEMLALLEARLANNPADEIFVAAREQLKITKIRLEKLFEEVCTPR